MCSTGHFHGQPMQLWLSTEVTWSIMVIMGNKEKWDSLCSACYVSRENKYFLVAVCDQQTCIISTKMKKNCCLLHYARQGTCTDNHCTADSHWSHLSNPGHDMTVAGHGFSSTGHENFWGAPCTFPTVDSEYIFQGRRMFRPFRKVRPASPAPTLTPSVHCEQHGQADGVNYFKLYDNIY